MSKSLIGKTMKEQLLQKMPKFGLFVNSASPIVAEQLSRSGFDWLLVDAQHGPMPHNNLHNMIASIKNGDSVSLTRVGSYSDRGTVQQALDAGCDGILFPQVNNRKEAETGVYSCLYPEPSKHKGSRSIYFPQRSSFEDGLLGYTSQWNENAITAVQIETKDGLENLEDIVKIDELDIVYVGKNDLAMSMGLFEKYQFPDMYSCKEMNDAMDKVVNLCDKHNKIPGIFLFGTDEVERHMNIGFNFIALGNDLHHMLMANQQSMDSLKEITSKLGRDWKKKDSNLIN